MENRSDMTYMIQTIKAIKIKNKKKVQNEIIRKFATFTGYFKITLLFFHF